MASGVFLFLSFFVAHALGGDALSGNTDADLFTFLSDSNPDTRINAAVELSERRKKNVLSSSVHENLRAVLEQPEQAPVNQRYAVVAYFSQLVPQMTVEEWDWFLRCYEKEKDPQVRVEYLQATHELVHDSDAVRRSWKQLSLKDHEENFRRSKMRNPLSAAVFRQCRDSLLGLRSRGTSK